MNYVDKQDNLESVLCLLSMIRFCLQTKSQQCANIRCPFLSFLLHEWHLSPHDLVLLKDQNTPVFFSSVASDNNSTALLPSYVYGNKHKLIFVLSKSTIIKRNK